MPAGEGGVMGAARGPLSPAPGVEAPGLLLIPQPSLTH